MRLKVLPTLVQTIGCLLLALRVSPASASIQSMSERVEKAVWEASVRLDLDLEPAVRHDNECRGNAIACSGVTARPDEERVEADRRSSRIGSDIASMR